MSASERGRSNTRLAWMDKIASLTINGGEAMILLGLVTAEWSSVKQQPDRRPYFETLDRLRNELIEAQTA